MARQRDEQKRTHIIITATRLFANKGYHATSIQDIVNETELSVGTIYLYFANKEEIFDALLENGLVIFTEELFENVKEDMEVEDLARSFVDTIIGAIHKNISVVTVLTNELSFQDKLRDFYSRIAEVISEKYIGTGAEGLYSLLKMSQEEFFAFITILISGLTNAMRLSAGRKGLIDKNDIRTVVNDVLLKSLLARIDPAPPVRK